MLWIFIVGTGVAFVISRLIMRFFDKFGEGLQRLSIIHAISGAALLALSAIAAPILGIAATAFYFLVAWFLPQVLCLMWDISAFSYNWARQEKN